VRVMISMTLRMRKRGKGTALSLAYAALTIMGKFAGVVGVGRFALGLLTGKRSRIIEHRRVDSNNSGAGVVPLGKSP
jgi:hypothetical protein